MRNKGMLYGDISALIIDIQNCILKNAGLPWPSFGEKNPCIQSMAIAGT
jgi:hypothetical protein